MDLRKKFFTDRTALITALADAVCERLDRAISSRGRATLAVSGGSTPKPLFEALSGRELAWDKVTLLLVDERWVAVDDPASNEHLVRSSLLQDRAAAATFIPMKSAAAQPREDEAACSQRLRPLFPLDLVLLGMGSDGHTASLFPGADRLDEAMTLERGKKKICMASTPPTAPHARMTLTLAAILDSREIIIHIVGDEKKTVLDQALAHGPVKDMPIRAILRQEQVPVTVFWAP